jgi:FG-GAP-like repeat/Metallo-peptidase family M12B Reprolysin-like/FG-GAP repeat
MEASILSTSASVNRDNLKNPRAAIMNIHSRLDSTNSISRLVCLLFVASLATPAMAHDATEAMQQAAPPSTSAPVVSVAGTLDELVVENRINNTTTRYVALRQSDGGVVTLKGSGLDALAKGAYVQASGRRSGDTLFVTGAKTVAAPQTNNTKVAKASLQNQAMQAQGSLLLGHGDNFATGKSVFNLVIHGDDGKMTPLKLAVSASVLQPGAAVIATGTKAEDGFSLAAGHIVIVAPPKAQKRNDVAAKSATTNNVLVVLIKFADSPTADPFTQAQVQQVMATNNASVVNYYSEVSYGQHLLNVTVTNWLTSPQPTPANCDYTAIANNANAAATAAGYNLGSTPPTTGSYQNVYYVFPYQSACDWGGWAFIGYGQAWSNGYNVLRIFAHELGHNFGLQHAASVDCNGQSITAGMSGCVSSEYGDPFSVMGGQTNDNVAMHFNAAQKYALGWIPPASVATYGAGTSTYTLTPIETAGGSTYALKIPAAPHRTFWLEYRQPIGSFDNALNYSTNGAQVRVASPFQSTCDGCADDTQLLYMPGGDPGNFYNSALVAGQGFTDSGITVNVLSASPTSLTVQVSGRTSAAHPKSDFNGDLSSDILWRKAATGEILMQTMSGVGATSSALINANSDWDVVATADFNGDGESDILWQQQSTGATMMQTMDGGTVRASYIINSSSDWSVAGVGDFNGDGKADILWKQASTGSVLLQIMNGSTVVSSTMVNADSGWTVAGVDDFNGDGKADILWYQAATGTVLMQTMDGSTATSSSTLNTNADWTVAGVGDFDGDGKADILWMQRSTGSVIMELMDGATVKGVSTINSAADWSVAGIGDFNGDGKADILWKQASTGQVLMQTMNGPTSTSSTTINASADWVVRAPGAR